MTVGGGAGDETALVAGGDVPDDQGTPYLTACAVHVQPHGGDGDVVLPPDDGGGGVPAPRGAVEPDLPGQEGGVGPVPELEPRLAVYDGLGGSSCKTFQLHIAFRGTINFMAVTLTRSWIFLTRMKNTLLEY